MDNIKLPFIKDPVTEKPSVSLTVFLVSTLTVVGAILAHLLGKTHDTSSAIEFFGVSAGLYFGRKWTSKNNSLDVGSGSSQEKQ